MGVKAYKLEKSGMKTHSIRLDDKGKQEREEGGWKATELYKTAPRKPKGEG